jgi:hypothetical protein
MPRRKSSIERLIAELRELGGRFHRNMHQDEFGPTRADRAQALREAIEQVDALQTHFKALGEPALSLITAGTGHFVPPERLLEVDPLDSYSAQKGAIESVGIAASDVHGEFIREGRIDEAGGVGKLRAIAETASLVLDRFDSTTESEVIFQLGPVNDLCFDKSVDGSAVVVELTKRLRVRLDRALDRLQGMRGPEPGISLALLVSQLCDLWEWETGQPVRANPYRNGQYEGRPQSASGRFVGDAIKALLAPKKSTDDQPTVADPVRAARVIRGGGHLDHAIHLAMRDYVGSKTVDPLKRGRGRPRLRLDSGEAAQGRSRLKQTM